MDPSTAESSYAYPAVDRPWVRMSMVTSLDGSATAADGASGDLGGEPDRQVYLLLRSLCDVVLVGAGTARDEGYGPVQVDDEARERRARLGLSAAPPIAVVSRRGEVPEPLRVAGTILVTTEGRCGAAPADVDVIVAGQDEVDWGVALEALAVRGLARVLCEGGPSLFGAIAAADLVDEVCLTVAPTVVLGGGPRIAHFTEARSLPFALGHAEAVDGVLLTRWLRDRT